MKITNISYRIKSKHGAHNKIKELPVKWWKKREKGTELVTDASWFPRDLLFILDGGPSPQSIPVRMINRAAIPRCSVSSKEPIWQCRKRRRPGLILGSGRSPGEENGNPLQYSCPENSMDRGAWQGTVHEVTKSHLARVRTSAHTHRQTHTHTHEPLH